MKRSLLICAAVMMLLQGMAQNVSADGVILTLDLNNATSNDAASGGVWQLYARRTATSTPDTVDGANGIAGIRAILNNIDFDDVTETGITMATGIGAQSAGATFANRLTPTQVELVYGQALDGTTVAGVGVHATATRDRLIASGTWAAGAARPTFGTDPQAIASEANFLRTGAAPWCTVAAPCLAPDTVTTEVYTLADLSGDGRVTSLDTGRYIAVLGGTLPYNPAGDLNVNQDGIVNSLDTGRYIGHLGNTLLTATTTAVPEPSTIGLTILASMGLIARRRRV